MSGFLGVGGGVTGAQGPQGSPGVTGTMGPAGATGFNAYGTVSQFTQPTGGANAAVLVPAGGWMQVGQVVFVASGGHYSVSSGSVPTFYIQNLGISGINLPPGQTIATGAITPGGAVGSTGVTGPAGFSGANRLTSQFLLGFSTGPTGPSALSFPVVGNNNYVFETYMTFAGQGCSGGYAVGISVPSGALITAQINGVSTATNFQYAAISNPSQFSGVATAPRWNYTGATGPMLISGMVLGAPGVTGVAQAMIAASAASGPTGFISTGSYVLVLFSN
jgi:hypothetical protein